MTYADKESAVTAAAGYKKWVDPLSQKILISFDLPVFHLRLLEISSVLVRFDHGA